MKKVWSNPKLQVLGVSRTENEFGCSGYEVLVRIDNNKFNPSHCKWLVDGKCTHNGWKPVDRPNWPCQGPNDDVIVGPSDSIS